MNKKTGILGRTIRILISVVVIFLYFWFKLPPINIRSSDFWSFIIFSSIVVFIINSAGFIKKLFGVFQVDENGKPRGFDRRAAKSWGKSTKIVLCIIGGVIVLTIIASIIGAPLFNAGGYTNLITLEDGSFADDVAELNMSQIPVVDRDTASRLGRRKLGEMSDLVSQFEIQEDYTQINYGGKPVRVTPLAYGDVIKWFNNQSKGLPAYITVDMVTQETALVRLDDGMKYSPSEYFMRDIDRFLRFNYPTKIFDEVSFEIDEDGVPFWVASTIKYRIGVWSGSDISGAVLVNAITGESQFYDFNEIPKWVDQVYPSYMVIEQLNYNGKYNGGFWNSIFGQKNVKQSTEGYNYIAINDDVYLYTGITSVSGDESNIGFVLVNLRTKETKYYSVPGAEEYSAMSSAEEQVQNLKYSATFPLLLNIADRPTYFMSLKGDAGLVKMYAFVDVEQYQVVGTGSTIEAAKENYISKLSAEVEIPDVEIEAPELFTAEGVVESLSPVVADGKTMYYFMLTGDENVYIAPVSAGVKLPFIAVGDKVSLEYNEEEGGVRTVTSVETIEADKQ